MNAKDVEEVEKPFVLIVGFFFHNDSILVGVGEAPVTLYIFFLLTYLLYIGFRDAPRAE